MPWAMEILLQRQPCGRRGALREFAVLGPVILRVQRRHPQDPGALACRDLHRERVHAADGGVKGERAEHPEFAAKDLVDHGGAFRGGHMVRLEHEAGQADIPAATCELQVGDTPPHHVRRHVHVQVVGASD